MPFEISPKPETGLFQTFGAALMRGCAMTKFAAYTRDDGKGGSCALGAMWVGMGKRADAIDFHPEDHEADQRVQRAYEAKYGTRIIDDNNQRHFTREQIAARIAAL